MSYPQPEAAGAVNTNANARSASISSHDSHHRQSVDLPPLPNIPRAVPNRYAASRPGPTVPPLGAPVPATRQAGYGGAGFTPVQRSSSRLSNRSFNQTFIDAPVTITALPEIRRQETHASVRTEMTKVEDGGKAEEGGEGMSMQGEKGKVVQVSQDGTEVTFPDGGKAVSVRSDVLGCELMCRPGWSYWAECARCFAGLA